MALIIAVAAQQAKVDPSAAAAGAGGTLGAMPPGGAVRAPDISDLTPQQRADRLYDRVMRLAGEEKTDSAAFFATMAVGAYADLPRDPDLHYDLGRMAEISGDLSLATAQADSILAGNPTHLLGLILKARVAQLRGNASEQQSFLSRVVAARDAELAKKLVEYERHPGDIDAAVAEARK